MKYTHILSLLLISLLTGCNLFTEKENKANHYTDFPTEKKLTAEIIPLDTALFRYPFRISIKDSVVLVMDLHNIDHFFHAFSYPDWKYITSFGQRGQGPEEMLSAETFHFFSLDSIWTLDANKMEITRWNLSPSLGMAERLQVIPIDKKLVRALDFYPIDSSFLIPDYLGDYRFHKIDQTGHYLSSHGTIPSQITYKDIARPALAQAWRSFIDYNPQNGKLALATQLGEVLEIYDVEQDTSKVIYGPFEEPEFKISQDKGIPSGIMGFSDIQITDNYIYTVFHGRSFKDILSTQQKGEQPEDGGRFIYLFDLEGNPICKYILDRAIYGIDVNEQTGIITATDVNNNESIVQFCM